MYVVNYLRKIGYIHKHSGTCRYPPHNFERFLTHHFAFFPLQYISLDLQCKCKGRDRHPWVTTVSPRREYFTATERESILCPRGRQDRILQNRLGEGWSLEQIKGRESLEISVTAMRQWAERRLIPCRPPPAGASRGPAPPPGPGSRRASGRSRARAPRPRRPVRGTRRPRGGRGCGCRPRPRSRPRG